MEERFLRGRQALLQDVDLPTLLRVDGGREEDGSAPDGDLPVVERGFPPAPVAQEGSFLRRCGAFAALFLGRRTVELLGDVGEDHLLPRDEPHLAVEEVEYAQYHEHEGKKRVGDQADIEQVLALAHRALARKGEKQFEVEGREDAGDRAQLQVEIRVLSKEGYIRVTRTTT